VFVKRKIDLCGEVLFRERERTANYTYANNSALSLLAPARRVAKGYSHSMYTCIFSLSNKAIALYVIFYRENWTFDKYYEPHHKGERKFNE
jgi:hypothetical protein